MTIRHKTCHVRDPASLNYLLDGGLKTCVGVHSACFEVLNLYAGVSQFDSGFKPLDYSARAHRWAVRTVYAHLCAHIPWSRYAFSIR